MKRRVRVVDVAVNGAGRVDRGRAAHGLTKACTPPDVVVFHIGWFCHTFHDSGRLASSSEISRC